MRAKLIFFLVLVVVLFGAASVLAQEKSVKVIFLTEANQRTGEGDWISITRKGEQVFITKLRQGALGPYGPMRWWGVDGQRTYTKGSYGTYYTIEVLHPITSKKGFILNVVPNRDLAKLGLEIPLLPQQAIKVTYSPTYYCDRRWLRVRNEHGKEIDKIPPNQDFYVLNVVFNKFPSQGFGHRFWAEIYLLHGRGWVALAKWYTMNITIADWKKIKQIYPQIAAWQR